MSSCKKYVTCKDCIHYVLCDNTSGLLAPELCDYYKSRSNFIELQDGCKNEIVSDLKNEITKINEGLFWTSENSTREYKYSEIVEIKKVLVQAYSVLNR